MDQPLWQPSAERIERANMTAFARRSRRRHGEALRDYAQAARLVGRARPRRSGRRSGAIAGGAREPAWDRVLVDGDRMPGARWFAGAELNFAENLLRHTRRSAGDHRLDRGRPAAHAELSPS